MSDVLTVEKKDGVATLTMNRPDKLNALNQALRAAVGQTFRELEQDDEVGVVILTGAGRAFSAGIDLKELGGETPSEASPASDFAMLDAVLACTRPIIGAINGHAITGGFELALACDILIGSTQARFADTHARVGILPGWGLSQRLPRLIGISRAKELSLSGNFLDGETAERWGLVNRVLPPEELLPHCEKLARDILTCDPAAVRRIKGMIDTGYAATFGEGLAYEARTSKTWLREVRPEDVAARRRGLQARGRDQQ